MNSCSHCSAQMDADALFCGECGHSVISTASSDPQCSTSVEPVAANPPISSVSRCSHCSAQVDANAPFCGECGQPVTSIASSGPQCASCSASVEPGVGFCGECGQPVTSAPEPISTAKTVNLADETANETERRPALKVDLQDVLFVVPQVFENTYNTLMVELLQTRGLSAERAHHHVSSINGHVVVEPSTALTVTQRVLNARLEDNRPPVALCLLGSDAQLPMSRVPDMTGQDEYILTDNFYGMTHIPSDEERYAAGILLPEVPVSRLPFLDPELIRTLLSADDTLAEHWNGGLAVSAEVWQGPSKLILESIARGVRPELMLCPPNNVEHVEHSLNLAPHRLYFNVHGSPMDPTWVGEGRDGSHPPVLRPELIDVASGAVVVSEACYGAHIFDNQDGIGSAFLQAGAGCFVGSTIVAWGAVDAKYLSCADLVAMQFFPQLDSGQPAAAALLASKQYVADRTMEKKGHLHPQIHNTLLSFVHYGNPLAHVVNTVPMPQVAGVTSKQVASTKAWTNNGSSGSALDKVRARMRGKDDDSALSQARQRLKSRLGAATWNKLSAGRVQLADLPSEFRDYTSIRNSLDRLLGSPPDDVNIFRYNASGALFVSVIASASNGLRLAALLLDGSDNILSELVGKIGGQRVNSNSYQAK